MVRMRVAQRHHLGTRVANPIEGRTGQIVDFVPESGFYTLRFHDGYLEQVDDASVDKFVIQPTQQQEESAESPAATDDGPDPQQLLGATISKTATSYEGKVLALDGVVTAYFPDTQTYRVAFPDGLYEDMSIEAARKCVEETNERKKKRAVDEDEIEISSSKKKKRRTSDNYNTAGADVEANEPPPLNTVKYTTRTEAYMIVRNVLRTILKQKDIAVMRTEKQATILNNMDIKPKRALENFVAAGGLNYLNKALLQWMKRIATQEGALLVLKVLAALPGVTPEEVLKSGIGRTLASIVRVSEANEHVPQVIGDLAAWVIRLWKKTVISKAVSTPKELLYQKSIEIREAGTSSEVYVAPASISMSKKQSEKQAITQRLRVLQEGKQQESAQRGSEEVEEITLPQYNSLGSEDARRPVRQTILIDSLACRINRDHYEGVRKPQNDGQEGKEQAEEKMDDDEVHVGRLKFGRPQLLIFNADVAVMDMLATKRTKALGNGNTNSEQDDAATILSISSSASMDNDSNTELPKLPLPNKTTSPAKPILKISNEAITPASQVVWK